MWLYNSLVVSIIVTVALIIVPAVILGPSEDDIVKLTLNVSFPSTILSLITVICIVLLLVPAIIVTVCGTELKSMPLPIRATKQTNC